MSCHCSCQHKHCQGKGTKYRVVTDLPILDIIAVIISFISLFVTLFIATGIIRIHKTVKNIDENTDDDDTNNGKIEDKN